MSLDQFYTPPDACAAAYSSWQPISAELSIGDFACGNGTLLDLAPFPNKIVYGMDIDPGVIDALRPRFPKWNLCTGDFLDPCPQADRFLHNLFGILDMIVLNPPFSCRGGNKQDVILNGKKHFCSKALAFVLKSLPFLNELGSLMAILPKSVLRSEKDAIALEHLSREWRIEVEQEFCRKTFNGCYPQSVCISLRRRNNTHHVISSESIPHNAPKVAIVRGCIPVHLTSPTGLYKVIHSTELRNADPIHAIKRYTVRRDRSLHGTFITLPRVGQPDLRKVRILEVNEKIMLSDCVFALIPEDILHVQLLLQQIQSNWNRLEIKYGSTCAPYITVAQVASFLSSCGWDASFRRNTNIS